MNVSPVRKAGFALFTLALIALLTEGAARAVFVCLEKETFDNIRTAGKDQLKNNHMALMLVPDDIYGYKLKPGYKKLDHAGRGAHINEQGFAQEEFVPIPRRAGYLRVVAQGESTTHGHEVKLACYPTYLRRILSERARGNSGIEVINGGVSGWISTQVALRAEHQLAFYKPDLVVLYTGWNDFQGYNPFVQAPPQTDYFELYFNKGKKVALHVEQHVKTVALLSTLVQKFRAQASEATPPKAPATVAKERVCGRELVAAEDNYRFYLKNLDRIVAAYRRENPKVTVALCTLVGRWPQFGQKEWDKEPPYKRTWWMKGEKVGPQEAACLFSRFNDVIRGYARKNNLPLIDLEQKFAGLDRSKMQWDFAHFNEDGYELLAESMYEDMVSKGIIDGAHGTRLAVLSARYQLPAHEPRKLLAGKQSRGIQ